MKVNLERKIGITEKIIKRIFRKLVIKMLYPGLTLKNKDILQTIKVIEKFSEDLGGEKIELITKDKMKLEATYFDWRKCTKKFYDQEFANKWIHEITEQLKDYQQAMTMFDSEAKDLIEFFRIGKIERKTDEKQVKAACLCHGQNGLINACPIRALTYISQGISVIEFNYRGYGKSTGFPSYEGTCLDGISACEFLIKKEKISPKEVVVHGISLGVGVASVVAQKIPGTHLIIDRGYSKVAWLAYDTVKSLLDVIPTISGRILIVHAQNDERMAKYHAVRNLKAITKAKFNGIVNKTNLKKVWLDSFIYGPGNHSFFVFGKAFKKKNQNQNQNKSIIIVWNSDPLSIKKWWNFLNNLPLKDASLFKEDSNPFSGKFK
ncbi:hypothetical protein M0811_02713 [Anaeramoeba ignava]|uniref:Alpha/beta hydrolase n=1 Tax=Anaeramoeba ignava TaxID=1746090 RepID=A0A9Q0LAA7_ANAIG|nr:hypothetical protein M0811_02713 [Anaeramoeba ignava]